MFEIVNKEELGPAVFRYWIHAPRVAKARQPGQFAIIRIHERGERIPLTIADVDVDKGLISLIVQTVGLSTEALSKMDIGQCIPDLAGPLGKATDIENFGHAVVVGGGLGTAVVYPQAVALRQAGNYVTGITGGRTKELVLLEDQLREVCDDVIACTDDGSYGRAGFVTEALLEMIENPDRPVDAVFTAGPVLMMKAVAAVTRPHEIKTLVSLNPIMVDGTGMCGGCRVTVGDKTFFACVDGPEFDGHDVDFDELADRLTTYRGHEAKEVVGDHKCKLGQQLKDGGGD